MEADDDYDSEEDEDYSPEAGSKKIGQKRKPTAGFVVEQGSVPAAAGGRGSSQGAALVDPLAELKERSKKAKLDAVWAQLNAPPQKVVKSVPRLLPAVVNGKQAGPATAVPAWMISLGLAKPMSKGEPRDGVAGSASATFEQADAGAQEKDVEEVQAHETARAVAAAAIAAARAAQAGFDLEGHPEVKELRSFAGEKIEVAVKVDQKAAAKRMEKPVSGLDALIQQIEKKKKVNVLDKSRQDWGDFKVEQGVTQQLENYKKSNDKYLDKVAFLQRAEMREYEVERDIKLAAARKKASS